MNRKIFTLGLILFALLGTGLNAYGQAVGDYVFTGGLSVDWTIPGNWGTSVDGTLTNTTAATSIPNGSNNVWIPSGKSVSIGGYSTTQASLSGTVNGSTIVTLAAANAAIVPGMYVFGTDIPTNTTVSAISGTTLTLSQAATGTSASPATDFLAFATSYATTATTTATGFSKSSTTITLAAANAAISAGMYVNGTGIAPGTTVVTNSGTTLTLSTATSAATTAAETLSFATSSTTEAPLTGIVSGSTTVTLAAANAAILAGMSVTATSGIPTGTTVSAISGTTLTLSQAATVSSSLTLTFGTSSSGAGSTTQTTTATGLTASSTTVTLSAVNPAILVGMNVTGSAKIANNTFVSVISGTTLTLSQAALISANDTVVTLTFTAVGSTTSSVSTNVPSGSTSITLKSANSSIFPGMYVYCPTIGIPNNTTVSAISGTTLTLSQATTIPFTYSTSSLTLTFAPGCRNLNVKGALYASGALNCTDSVTVYNGGTLTTNNQLTCTGDIYVQNGGTFSMPSTVYCANIYNFGTFNAGTAQYNSPKALYAGFIGTTPGTGAYNIVNNGIFGGTAPSSTIGTGTTAVGSGIRIYYSEQCTSYTIGTSTPGVTGYAFNIGAIEPNYSTITSSPSNQAFTLNLNENMSLLYGAGISLSLQQGNQTGATRTCNIPAGVTVYSGGRFHSNASAPTALAQGNFVYNVYGTLDLSSFIYSSIANPTDFDLWLTTLSGNTGNITFNLGDGTHPASLVLGKSIKLVKQTQQSINMNFNTNSTVTFASSTISNNTGGTVYTLLNNGNPAVYLFPTSYYNLTINNSATILPVVPLVRGTSTYTASGYGTANWAASTAYTSTTTAQAQGGVIFTGTNYYYVPNLSNVYPSAAYASGATSITFAAVNDTLLNYITAGQIVSGTGIATTTQTTSTTGNITAGSPNVTLSGSNTTIAVGMSVSGSGIAAGTTVSSYNNISFALVLSTNALTTATAAVKLTFTASPTTSGTTLTLSSATTLASASPITALTFTGTSGTTAPTATSTNNHPLTPVFDGTQSLIYLGSAAFANPIPSTATSVNLVNSNNVLVYSTDNQIIIKGAQVGDLAIVYNISGIEMAVTKVTSDYTTINAPSAGVYLVKVGNQVTKVLVR